LQKERVGNPWADMRCPDLHPQEHIMNDTTMQKIKAEMAFI